MALLKKIKASTLMETLVATVLIMIVFMVASMILNNLFSIQIKNNTQAIDTHLNELEYLHIHQKINVPYRNQFKEWDIKIEQYTEGEYQVIELEAQNKQTNKVITKQRLETEY